MRRLFTNIWSGNLLFKIPCSTQSLINQLDLLLVLNPLCESIQHLGASKWDISFMEEACNAHQARPKLSTCSWSTYLKICTIEDTSGSATHLTSRRAKQLFDSVLGSKEFSFSIWLSGVVVETQPGFQWLTRNGRPFALRTSFGWHLQISIQTEYNLKVLLRCCHPTNDHPEQ